MNNTAFSEALRQLDALPVHVKRNPLYAAALDLCSIARHNDKHREAIEDRVLSIIDELNRTENVWLGLHLKSLKTQCSEVVVQLQEAGIPWDHDTVTSAEKQLDHAWDEWLEWIRTANQEEANMIIEYFEVATNG